MKAPSAFGRQKEMNKHGVYIRQKLMNLIDIQ